RDGLRHAFGVEVSSPVAPDDDDRPRIEELLRRIVAREMTGPAVLLLESWRPMNGVTAQAMHALTPFVGLVADASVWERLARYLQRRGSIPWIIDRLEAMQSLRDESPLA
ncbi:MAG: hypothetical protein ACKPEA_18630, partial [Planctomycetota bacterium]